MQAVYLIVLCQFEAFPDFKALWDIDHLQLTNYSTCSLLSRLKLTVEVKLTSALPSLSSMDSDPCLPMTPLPFGSWSSGVRDSGTTMAHK